MNLCNSNPNDAMNIVNDHHIDVIHYLLVPCFVKLAAEGFYIIFSVFHKHDKHNDYDSRPCVVSCKMAELPPNAIFESKNAALQPHHDTEICRNCSNMFQHVILGKNKGMAFW